MGRLVRRYIRAYKLTVKAGGLVLDEAGTAGITLSAVYTDAILISGANTDSIHISGANATAIKISGANTTAAISISAGTTIGLEIKTTAQTDGILISSACVDAIHISGASTANAINISGANVYGISISGANTTAAISISAGTTIGLEIKTTVQADGILISAACTDGIHVSGACATNAINISGANVYGISISGANTTAAISISAGTTIGLEIKTTAQADGILISGACTDAIHISGAVTTAINLGSATTTRLLTGTISTSGSSKRDAIDINWNPATTYGSGGDRWGGSGSMEGCLTIGDDGGACPITGTGSHLGEYINLSVDVALANTFDIVGGLYSCVSAGIAQTMGILNGITSHLRNPSYLLGGANQRIDALRSVIYTGSTAETQHQVGALISILDMTTTKTLAQDVSGAWIQLNVANAAAGGNLQGIVLDNVGAVIASAGIKFQGSGDWTYAFQFVDDTFPASSTGSVSVQAGYITVIIGAAVRYIPLYSS